MNPTKQLFSMKQYIEQQLWFVFFLFHSKISIFEMYAFYFINISLIVPYLWELILLPKKGQMKADAHI